MSWSFKKKEWLGLIAVVLLSAIFLCALYLVNGTSVFTHSLITSDGRIGTLELYYHLWDFLHGDKSLYFDWYSGLGTNMAGVISHSGINSFLNIVFFFIRRDQIFITYAFLTNLRFVLLGVTMYIFLISTNKDKHVLAVIGSLCYAFNFYTVAYSFFNYWIDIAIIFPIFMLFLIRLMESGKGGFVYTLLLAYMLMLDINLAPMIVIFVILFAGIKLYLMKGNCHITELILFSVCGSLVSLAFILPGFIQISKSARAEGSIVSAIWQGYRTIDFKNGDKWLIGCLPVISSAIGIAGFKKDEKCIWTIMTIIMALSVVVEGSNLFWHMGSYEWFTMRFGFMAQFCSIMVLMNVGKTNKPILVTGALAMSAITILALTKDSWSSCSKEVLIVCLALLASVAIMMSGLKFKNHLVLSISFAAMLAISNSVIIIEENNPEYKSLVSQLSDQVQDDSYLNRIKWEEFLISHSNYPMVIKRSAQSNFLHFIHYDQAALSRKLGYYQPFTKQTDVGGTLVSDALFNTTTYITKQYYPEELAQKTGAIDEFDIYQNNMSQFGFYLYGDIDDEYETELYAQNALSKAIFNKEIIEITRDDVFGNFQYEKVITVDEPSYVYLTVISPNLMRIYVNDEMFDGEYENGWCETQNEGVYIQRQREILNLGYVEDSIKIMIENPSGPAYQMYVGVLPVEEYLNALGDNSLTITTTEGKDTMDVVIESDKDGKVILPIFGDSFNGQYQELFGNALIVVPVKAGTNTFSFKVKIPGMTIGFIAAAIGLAGAMILSALLRKKQNLLQGIQGISSVATYCVFGLLILAIAVLPSIMFVIEIVSRVLE